MTYTIKLLDMFKKTCSITTDMAAAERIGVSKGSISNWRHERNHAEPESVEFMAKACGLDPEEWVLRVQADRESSINPKRAQVWLRCAQRIAAAASIALGIGLITSQTHASDTSISSRNSVDSVYYVK